MVTAGWIFLVFVCVVGVLCVALFVSSVRRRQKAVAFDAAIGAVMCVLYVAIMYSALVCDMKRRERAAFIPTTIGPPSPEVK